MSLTAIDLFCGAGGLSLGLEQAGFRVLAGVDSDRHALGTWSRAHTGKAVLADVESLSGPDLLAAAGVDGIDLLAGGPSCQGFSTHGKRLDDDPRNMLYVQFMRLVAETRPRAVLIENVQGLLLAAKGAYRHEVERSLADLGYQVASGMLHAVDFGVPQRRRRVFFLGVRGMQPGWPAESGSKPRTVEDAIANLPPAAEADEPVLVDGREVWNHVRKPLSDLALSVVSRLGPGQGLRSLPQDDLPARFRKMRRTSTGDLRRDCTTLYHRLAWDEPAYTVTANFTNVSSGAFTHPREDRAITAREAARLQAFPDSFRFYGAGVPRQIGNAVPPPLAKAVGRELAAALSS